MKLHANADDSSGALKHTLYWELEENDYDFLDVPEKSQSSRCQPGNNMLYWE